MFTLTDEAAEELISFFESRERAVIRVYLADDGCSGVKLALVVDEAGEGDCKFRELGFDFCMASDLYEKAKDVVVDAGELGFMVHSSGLAASGPATSGPAAYGSDSSGDGDCGK